MNEEIKKEIEDKINIFYSATDEQKNGTIIIECTFSQGQLLKELRTALEVPQKEIAQKMGLTQPTLSAHEKRKEVNASTLVKYVDCLGITDETFVDLLEMLSGLNLDSLNDLLTLSDEDLKEKAESFAEGASETAFESKKKQIYRFMDSMNYADLMKLADYAEMVNDQKKYRNEKNK